MITHGTNFSLMLALASSLGLFLWWIKKWKLYKQKQLEELNLCLEVKVEERTNELRQQLYFTQTLLDAIPNPVYFKDEEGRYLGCNKSYEEFRGITKEDFIGKCVLDIAVPEDAEALHAIDLKLLSGSGGLQYETSLLLNNGIRRDVIFHKACFYKITGEPAGLIGVVQDVTAIKNAKLTIKKQNEELEQKIIERTRSLEDANEKLVTINRELELRRREAESTHKKLQQLSSAVVNSPVTVLIADCLGNIEYVNPKFTEITGYLPEEVIGQNPRILNAGTQPKELYRELWATILDGRVWCGDFCNKKKNGDMYWEHASISPIRDENGSITHFVAIKEDVTEQKRIASELVTARDAANAATRSKSEFLANMSHEIRTPLNAIIGFSALTLKTNLPPRQLDYVRKIHTAGELLLNIINDILDFSKIEAGRLVMERIPFMLKPALANIIDILQQKALDKQLCLSVEISPEVAHCLIGDPHRLSQIILNLLSNAIKFTEHGEILLETSLLTRQSDRVRLKFSVHDSGIGISSENIEKLFQPFTQADGSTTRRFGGTGLGLSISKQLVDMLGGEIWCESRPGKGSSFCFTAWFGIGDSRDVEQCAYVGNTSGGRKGSSYNFSGSCILLVEDNEINQQLAIELLKGTGATVHLAANGKEAVSMISGAKTFYDLVLMDIQMPVMDGYEATLIIRSDIRFASLPIIAMTAHAMQDEQEKIIQVGMNACISKPIDARSMLDTVASFLDGPEPDMSFHENSNDEPAIPDIKGLDVSAALWRIEGDRTLYLWVLRTFIENQSNTATLIEAAMNANQTELAVRHVHTIKGIAGTMGATDLEKLALNLENAILHNDPPETVKPALVCFTAELNRLVADLMIHLPAEPCNGENEIKGIST